MLGYLDRSGQDSGQARPDLAHLRKPLARVIGVDVAKPTYALDLRGFSTGNI
jgi:hypothetical protein